MFYNPIYIPSAKSVYRPKGHIPSGFPVRTLCW